MAWGKNYLARRKQAKSEKEIVEKKLGRDEDTDSLNQEVRRMENLEAARSTDAKDPKAPTEGHNPGSDEPAQSHQHDHVLAMIHARP